MPKPTFKSFIGVAKEIGRTVLAAPVAAGATAITLIDPTGFTATSKITIYDEAGRTVSITPTALTGSVLTVPALVYSYNAGVLITTLGTASTGPTDYIPVLTIAPVDNSDLLDDTAWRGSQVEMYDTVLGVRTGGLDLSGNLHPDTYGYVLGCLLGDVQFTAASPNTHAFSVKNSGDGQPVSYQITDFNGIEARQYGGVQFSESGLKFDSKGFITWTSKAMAYASGIVSTPAPSYSAISAVAAWNTTVTIAGVTTANVESLELTIKRGVEAIQTLDGGRDPLRMWSGPAAIEGKADFVMDDDTELNRYLTNSQPTFVVTANVGSGASQVGITVQLSKANYKSAVIDRGKGYVVLKADVRGLGNTTDAGPSGGYSPGKITLRNAKPTGTFV